MRKRNVRASKKSELPSEEKGLEGERGLARRVSLGKLCKKKAGKFACFVLG